MNRAEIFTGSFRIFFHSTLTDDDADTSSLYEFVFKLFHSHRGSRTYRNHLKPAIFQRTDDRARMQNRRISYIHRKFPPLFHQAAVRHIPAGREISIQINDISDMDIL